MQNFRRLEIVGITPRSISDKTFNKKYSKNSNYYLNFTSTILAPLTSLATMRSLLWTMAPH
jgi:hypothetical protein